MGSPSCVKHQGCSLIFHGLRGGGKEETVKGGGVKKCEVSPRCPTEPDPLKRSKIYFGITPADFTITRDPE